MQAANEPLINSVAGCWSAGLSSNPRVEVSACTGSVSAWLLPAISVVKWDLRLCGSTRTVGSMKAHASKKFRDRDACDRSSTMVRSYRFVVGDCARYRFIC